MDVFKSRLATLRKLKGLSQAELAEKIGVHPNIIGRYERDLAKPSMELAVKLAEALEVSIDYLAGKVNNDLDKDIVRQVLSLQQLPPKEKEHILFTLNALIRDAKSRFAYT